jgi:hypothetical protein
VAVPVGSAGVPNEALEELVGVLLFDKETAGLDDIADVIDELLARRREGIGVDGRVFFSVQECLVDLLVGRHATIAECLDDTVEAKLHD